MSGIFIPVLLFAISMTLTPGPNNMLLTVSGASYGFRRTVPLIAGIVAGIVSLLTLAALGLGALFETLPALRTVLKITGSAYLAYLAFRIMFAKAGTKDSASHSRPLSFLEGVGFQYLNPKAYITSRKPCYFPSRPKILRVFIFNSFFHLQIK